MKIRLKLLPVILIFMLLSCSVEDKKLKQYIAQIKARKPSVLVPLRPLQYLKQFHYTGNSYSPSPFNRQAVNKVPAFFKKSYEMLAAEAFIRTMRFVGLMQTSLLTWGLIQDKKDRVFPVKLGDLIGKEGNLKVIKIKKTCLVLELQGMSHKKIVKLFRNAGEKFA